jgi:hypothetical protein
MVKELLYRLYSFEMTLRKGDDKEKGITKSLKVEDILSRSSRPPSMLAILKQHHLGRTGEHRAHLGI